MSLPKCSELGVVAFNHEALQVAPLTAVDNSSLDQMIAAIEQPEPGQTTLFDGFDRSEHAWLSARLDRPRWALEARTLALSLALEQQGRAGLWASFILAASP